jgi:LysM repeat protein
LKSIQLLISFFLIAILNYSASGQQFFNTFDTLEILAPSYDQLVIKHIVESNQSLESIASHYGLEKYDLIEFNPSLFGAKTHMGQIIQVPIPLESIRKINPEEGAEVLFHPLIYKVKAGENFFHVANRLFDQSMDSLQLRNKLDNLELIQNQKLHIGWLAKFGIPSELQTKRLKIQIEQNQINQDIFNRQISDKKELTNEQGSAVKMTKNKSIDLVCLHKDLERGKILKVENPMNGRILYLKVIGSIPQHFEQKVKLVTPEYVAKLLGVIDESFYIKIQY